MIEVDRLTKRFGSVTAVDGLSFTVRPGHVTGFLGPNGAGKTTTMRVILGLDAPTSGTARVNQKRYAELGLDTEGIAWIRQFFKALAAEGRTVLVSSHLMSEMSQTADHLIVIGRGRPPSQASPPAPRRPTPRPHDLVDGPMCRFFQAPRPIHHVLRNGAWFPAPGRTACHPGRVRAGPRTGRWPGRAGPPPAGPRPARPAPRRSR
jgi:energy-coupling factor transporter ATP-binding protein EcfA2